MDRRDFGKQALGSLLTYSLLETVFSSGAFSAEIAPIAAKWLAEINSMSHDLKGEKLTQTDWQDKVEQLFQHVNLAEFLSFIDFEKMTKDLQFKDLGERSLKATFPKVEGLPTELVFGHQLFALGKGRSVVPHGHENMATSFLVLQGEFEGKHYDRLEDHKDHMIIKPTIDRKFVAGEYSSISDHRDNVHWFKATNNPGYIFNIHVLNVDPKINHSGRVYIDPFGEKLADGKIKADKIRAADAFKKFG